MSKTNKVQQALKDRHKSLHPLIFHRSLEKACSDVELFEILEYIPDYPITWDQKKKSWVHVNDLLVKNF
jgi:hypothetical protein